MTARPRPLGVHPGVKRRIGCVIAGGVLLFGVLFPPNVTSAAAAPRRRAPRTASVRSSWPENSWRDELAFVADINSLRARRGVAPLKIRPELVRKARRWATTLAAAPPLRHSKISDGIRSDWQKLGENVGVGRSQPTLHAAFVASSDHLENLLDPAFRYVGIGVVHTGRLMFVSEVFMEPVPALPRRTRTRRPPTARRQHRVQRVHSDPRAPIGFRSVR